MMRVDAVSDSSEMIGVKGQTSFHTAQTRHIAAVSALWEAVLFSEHKVEVDLPLHTILFHLGFQVANKERRDRLIIDV